MASGAATVDRLRDFLRELQPDSRTLLIGELERKILRGEEVAGAELVLKELRRLFRESRETAPRYGNAARTFFRPLDSFLVEDASARKHPGRVSRTSLGPLWAWIRRDLLPEEAQAFSDIVGDALIAGDEAAADAAARGFQDKVVAAIEHALAGVAEKAGQKLIAQIGTPRAQDDATHLMHALRLRDDLLLFAELLPGYIATFADARLTETKALIDGAVARDKEIMPFALLILMKRLAAPWQLVRLVPKGQSGARADSPYAVAAAIVLAEVARLGDELRGDLQNGGVGLVGLLQTIHDMARGLRLDLDPAPESLWARDLASVRAQIANLLHAEIESVPGRVRRLLRPRPSQEIRANSALDPAEVADTEALIGLLAACRQFASELALNEMTQRSYSDVQQFLDSGTGALLDALRHAGAADRSFRQSQADAAVRFCRKVFGPDYASMLTKAAELAGHQA